MGRTHWGDPADPLGQWQERYSNATGPSPAKLHQGPWQTSPGAMEATGDRRAGTQSRRGSPARQSGPATQATRVRRSYRRLAGAIPLVVRDTPHGRPREGACGRTHGHMWGHSPTWDTWTGWPRQCLLKHMRERLKRHHRAVGGTGRPLGKTFFLQCQRRHPDLPKIPTYLPTLVTVSGHIHRAHQVQGRHQFTAQNGISRPQDIPTKAPVIHHHQHIPGDKWSQTANGGRTAHQRALAHITVRPTAHLPQDFRTERQIVLEGQAQHTITAAPLPRMNATATTLPSQRCQKTPHGPNNPVSRIHIDSLLHCMATTHLWPPGMEIAVAPSDAIDAPSRHLPSTS